MTDLNSPDTSLHGELGWQSSTYKVDRQINRYRATATLWQPQIKQYTTSNEGMGLQNQREHHIILTEYEATHPTAVWENNSLSGMLIILTNTRTVFNLSNFFAGKFNRLNRLYLKRPEN